MTAIPYQSALEVERRSDPESVQAARRHRVALLHTMQAVEEALAAPAQEVGWRDRVFTRLQSLRAAFAEHIVVTEGPSGLYAELLEHAPRLCRRVHRLVREHTVVEYALAAVERRAALPETTVEELRSCASDLLRELSRHRQRGADVVYEAYQTDIGGET